MMPGLAFSLQQVVQEWNSAYLGSIISNINRVQNCPQYLLLAFQEKLCLVLHIYWISMMKLQLAP